MKRSFAVMILLAVALASSAFAAETPKEQEFNALKARATALGKRLNSTNAAESRQALADWQKLVAEFDAWAARHKVQTKSSTVQSQQTGGTGFHSCPPYDMGGPCYYCVLDPSRSRPGVCVYKCYRYC